MSTPWRLLNTGKHHAAMNMAVDEAILLGEKAYPQPTLRFYDWSQPAFSFGYFQVAEEIDLLACAAQGIELVRRATGGGIVIHGWDVTYSLIVPHGTTVMPKDIRDSYRLIADCLLNGLWRIGVPVERHQQTAKSEERRKGLGVRGSGFGIKRGEGWGVRSEEETYPHHPHPEPLTPHPSLRPVPNTCLTQAAQDDLLLNGRKVAGVSQRRNRIGVMYQGYIALDMPPSSVLACTSKQPNFHQELSQKSTAIHIEHSTVIQRHSLEQAVVTGFEETLGLQFAHKDLSADELSTSQSLIATKYGTPTWTFRR